MQRISTEIDGVFKNGVPGVQRGTKFNAEWCNAVQEEIAQFIELAGLTLDGSNPHQLRDALLAIFMAGIQVGGSGITISGVGGAVTITNGGMSIAGGGQGSAPISVVLSAQGLEINGVNVKEITTSGVATLNIDETLELVKNLIVNGLTTLKGNARVNGDLTVDGDLVLENLLEANVNGNINRTAQNNSVYGNHYGKMSTNEIRSLAGANTPIAVKHAMLFEAQAHFQQGFVCTRIELPSTGYTTILLEDARYMGLPDGSVVFAVNNNDAISGIAVSANSMIVVKKWTGVELIKHGSSWYPTCPTVDVVSR